MITRQMPTKASNVIEDFYDTSPQSFRLNVHLINYIYQMLRSLMNLLGEMLVCNRVFHS